MSPNSFHYEFKLIVFDLDDTILDTSKELLHIANTPQFFERIKTTLPLLDGALDNLEYLSTKYILVLLTQGNISVQKQKINTLQIEKFFKKIYFADLDKAESKTTYFRQILKDFSVQASDCLSIGNRRSTDVRLAKQLNYYTCLHKYGEHKNESIDQPEDIADFEFSKHQELISICQL